ncbi:MAG TPA: PAS domain-containing sensor histidine kinase [Bryobacteraceae bacterium]|nr:PAS domain-containing sensor histidine kinase [Bryobacteraceae bacterium]
MTRLDHSLAFAESHRTALSCAAALLIAVVAWLDWLIPNTSVGYLYLIPILLSAAGLNTYQILLMALLCGWLREAADPLQGEVGYQAAFVLNPAHWVAGSWPRFIVAASGFATTGFFVGELNRRRRLLLAHLDEREKQMKLLKDAELKVHTLIETSPLAILTLDHSGQVALANESARQLLAFEDEPLQGQDVTPYLPILSRMLHHSGSNMRTNVECRGHRRNGDVFLAHVWLSTYRTSQGAALAAVVWDASENLRDREGAGLDAMMATSRVLIGAMSHEIRNLAAAAASAYSGLAGGAPEARPEQYQALGSLIQGLEKIASTGLRIASSRETVVADLGTVLDETRILLDPALREAGIQSHWEVRPGLPLVQADHHALLQAFINLARNSLSALENSQRKEMRIVAGMERDLVVVRFHDTGPGVAHPEELFQPFQPGAQSVGLGLYVTRAILRSHGGGLRYEAPETGSCFAVELWPAESAAQE